MTLSDIAAGLAVLISGAALIVAIRAHWQSGAAQTRELRMQTRHTIENAKMRIGALPDHIRHLDISVIYAMAPATQSPEDTERHLAAGRRQCAEMFEAAKLMHGQIEKLDTGLGDKSEAELEHLLQDANRLNREADKLHDQIASERAMYDCDR